MFLGTHTPRLDDKGRLALPARFRPELEGGLVICKGQEHCLFIYPSAEFHQITTKLRSAPVTDVKVRNYSRILFASAFPDTPDGQGRITIPPTLREYARLSKECVVIGASNRIEVWDAESWQAYLDANEEGFSGIAEEVLPGEL
jgi:MraZ protein